MRSRSCFASAGRRAAARRRSAAATARMSSASCGSSRSARWASCSIAARSPASSRPGRRDRAPPSPRVSRACTAGIDRLRRRAEELSRAREAGDQVLERPRNRRTDVRPPCRTEYEARAARGKRRSRGACARGGSVAEAATGRMHGLQRPAGTRPVTDERCDRLIRLHPRRSISAASHALRHHRSRLARREGEAAAASPGASRASGAADRRPAGYPRRPAHRRRGQPDRRRSGVARRGVGAGRARSLRHQRHLRTRRGASVPAGVPTHRHEPPAPRARTTPIRRTAASGAHAPPPKFARAVYALVREVPRGKVVTYGQVAAILGHPRAARAVGTALSNLPRPLARLVPWQRVINAGGRISIRGDVHRARSAAAAARARGHRVSRRSRWT